MNAIPFSALTKCICNQLYWLRRRGGYPLCLDYSRLKIITHCHLRMWDGLANKYSWQNKSSIDRHQAKSFITQFFEKVPLTNLDIHAELDIQWLKVTSDVHLNLCIAQMLYNIFGGTQLSENTILTNSLTRIQKPTCVIILTGVHPSCNDTPEHCT